ETEATLGVHLAFVAQASTGDRIRVEVPARRPERKEAADFDLALHLVATGALSEAVDFELAEGAEGEPFLAVAVEADDGCRRGGEVARKVTLAVDDDREAIDRRAPNGAASAQNAVLAPGSEAEAVGLDPDGFGGDPGRAVGVSDDRHLV